MEFTGERVVPGKTPLRIYEDHIERYKFAVKYVNDKCVLDIACGVGYGSKCLSNGGASRVVGVDISKEAVSYAKTNYKSINLNFLRGDATRLPFQNNYFDIVVSFETIEHIPDHRKFLAEVSRILKAGGTFIVSTPNRTVTSPSKSLYQKPNNIHHFVEYTPHEFDNILKNFSFEDIHFFGQRMIHKRMMNRFVRIFASLIKPEFYSNANGSSTLIKLPKILYVPRYVIVICKKTKFLLKITQQEKK